MATEDFPSLCCQVQQGALLDAEQMDSLKHHLEQLTFTKQMPDDASSQDLLLTHLTLLQNVLRYGFHEEQYADICQAVPQVVPHTLVSMLSWPDQWVGYLASKCVTLVLAQPTMQERLVLVVEEMISLLLSAPSLSHVWVNVLQVFNFIFSKKKLWPTKRTFTDIDDIQSQALAQLEKSWPLLRQTFHVSLTTQLHPPHVSVSFLSLWTKLLKFLRLQTADVLLMRSWQVLELTPSLLVYLRSPGLSVAVYNRILDVCTQVLPCGGREGLSTAIKLQLSQAVLQAVDDDMLDHVPLQDGDVSFPGPDTVSLGDQSTEGATPHEPAVKKRKQNDANFRPSAVTLRKLTTFLLSCCTCCIQTISKSDSVLKSAANVSQCLLSLWRWVCRWHCPPEGVHWAVAALAEQDDRLVAAMMYLLEIHTAARFGKISMCSPLIWKVINPHEVFLSFLWSTSHDHRLLLDLLISPETCFLLYLIRYLHYVVNCWQDLVMVCQQREQLESSRGAAEDTLQSEERKKEATASGSKCRSTIGGSEMLRKGGKSDTVVPGPSSEIISNGENLKMTDSAMDVDRDTKGDNLSLLSPGSSSSVDKPGGLSSDEEPPGYQISSLGLDEVVSTEAAVADMSSQLEHHLQQGQDLGWHLAGLLRQVSGQRLRLMEGPLVEDVSTTQLELQRKQKHMAELLKSAEDILKDSDHQSENIASTVKDDNIVKDNFQFKVPALVSASYYSDSMDTDEEEDPPNAVQGTSNSDSDLSQLALPSSVYSEFRTFRETRKDTAVEPSAWPKLTAYSDSDSDDEDEDESMAAMDMVKGLSHYLDTTSECASLMTVVGRLTLGEQPTKPLLDYPDSDSDTEQDLYGRLAEAVVLNKEEISYELSAKDKEAVEVHLKSNSNSQFLSQSVESSMTESNLNGPCETLDEAMSVLIRLRLAIERMAEKEIFPYNAEPLLRILMRVEACYEGEDMQ